MKFGFGDTLLFDQEDGTRKFIVSSIHRDPEGKFWYCGGDYSWIAEERLSKKDE